MATLSQLVNTVAKCEGMDPATVSLIARGVREARLITTGGRGLSAAKMTVADAANLLIAVNATVSAREAPQTVRNYRRLETVAWFRRDGKVVHAERTQLGDAIEHLIEAASIRTLKNYLTTTVPLLIAQEFHKERAKIELIFHKPMPYAHLTISALEGYSSWIGGLRPEDDDFDKSLDNVQQIEFKFNLPSDPVQRRAKRHYGDRKDTTSIGYSTIRAISKLFGEKAER
jgi:hypothetical protein